MTPRQLFTAFAIALVVLLVNAGVSLRAIGRLQALQERVEHTLRVKGELQKLLVNVFAAESAQRGYLLSERPAFLAPYVATGARAQTSADSLARLVSDNAEQAVDAVLLERYATDKLAFLARLVETQGSAGVDEAVALFATERGKMLMDSTAAIAARMQAREQVLLAERQRLAAEAQRDLSATFAISTSLALALIGGLYLFVRKDLRRRESEARFIRDYNEQLERRVGERTAALANANAAMLATNEELGRSNRELQDFAFVASHDLQEPLRKIRTFADLLREDYGDVLPDDAKHSLVRMQDAATRMSRLISDLLAFSRLSTRATPLAPVALDDIARDAVAELETAIEESGATVEVGPLPTIDGDAGQLRQLFQNLIGNAIKFRREGEAPRVIVRAAGADGAGREVIEVADNGIGFDEKYLDRIFTPFQRLHTRGDYPGTGIGLAIVRKVVERHHGTVTARSRVGAGTTFVVALAATASVPLGDALALGPVAEAASAADA